jgi:hypothetical protein
MAEPQSPEPEDRRQAAHRSNVMLSAVVETAGTIGTGEDPEYLGDRRLDRRRGSPAGKRLRDASEEQPQHKWKDRLVPPEPVRHPF